ncbi:uncharacterized protein VTP21DRAFT_4664 [Calcarisporiella thermophila]|uniref:uncharacterized protein n=1 Tax=Calcarisporiella thermophila TaxID=911321 RepID=UPI00374445D0
MANTSAKKIAIKNKKTLENLQRGFLIVNAVYVLVRVIFFWSSFSTRHWIGYLSTLGLSLFLYRQLYQMGNPTYASDGQLVRSGEDLSAEGLTAYIFDIIYITWFVHLASILSDKFWYTYLAIPCYAVYKAWGYLSPFLFGRSGADQGQGEPAQSKRQQKLQKRQEMGHVKYR